jgi:hypothetical protein
VACLTLEEVLYNYQLQEVIALSNINTTVAEKRLTHFNRIRLGYVKKKGLIYYVKKRTDILPSETRQLSLPSQQALIQPVKIEKVSYTSTR